jgi:hypothetical protein
MQRVGSIYLWFSPLAFVVLAGLYHYVNFWAGVAGGVVHLALVALGLYQDGAFKERRGESGSLLGPVLLVFGGALMWATGPSGPPDPAHLAVAQYTQLGVTLGFLVTLLGFAATVPALDSTRERALGSVGFACFALMFVGWWVDAAVRQMTLFSTFASMPHERWPELLQLFVNFSRLLLGIGLPLGYLAGAVFAGMAIRGGWVRRGAGLAMFIYCWLGVPLSAVRSLIPVSSLSEMPVYLYPYLPPAMICLVPYYVGVLRLKRPTA